MGGEPLNDGSTIPEQNNKPLTKLFEAYFPFFLSIGMTHDQYWRGDVMLCKAYRKSHEMINKRDNQMMWTQGRYNYIATQTALNNLFRKSGTPPYEYLSMPFPLTKKEAEEQAEQEQKEKAYKMHEAFKAQIIQMEIQASIKKSQEEQNGSTDNREHSD